jgi:hypothetical protein
MIPSDISLTDMQQKFDKLLNTIAETSGDLLIMIEQNPDGP